ncbi:MAG: M42 family peptidase [Anaerolineaceae bacterium]|jgi:endoglucanase|nr:MAG: M42 family peptidase [Anaerolineaceae bacterium]
MKTDKADFILLEKLVEIPGVPGREERVADLIRSSLPAPVCDCSLDKLGNLIAHIPGKGKKVMVVAHMDEVGFIVQRILPEGFLKVERLGGSSLRALPGSRLSLWSSKGYIPALAGVLPQHLDTNEPITDFSKVTIDIGSSSCEETRAKGVRPGDVLTWDSPLRSLGDTLICGKALDDRLGCSILIKLAKILQPQELKCDLYLTFTVQEETMLMGGITAANSVSPDVIIGIDGTLSFDTPDLEGKQSDIRLGAGPAIKWMDAIRGKLAAFVPNQKLTHHVCEIAQKNGIPLQDEIAVGMSTAITPMLYASNGAQACAISVPIRYHHTPVETADLRDVENVVLLLKHVLTNDL